MNVRSYKIPFLDAARVAQRERCIKQRFADGAPDIHDRKAPRAKRIIAEHLRHAPWTRQFGVIVVDSSVRRRPAAAHATSERQSCRALFALAHEMVEYVSRLGSGDGKRKLGDLRIVDARDR